MWYRALPALSLLVALAPATAAAQGGSPPVLQDLRGGMAAAFETYGFSDAQQTGIDHVSLLTVPFGARTRLLGSSSLEVSGAYARGQLTHQDGTTVTLAGFTDTQIALAVPLKQDVATVTAIASLPTGVSRMTADEAIVAGVVASDLLPFRISNWGAGGAAGVSGAVAHSLGAVGIGASASYLVGHEYDLVEPGAFAYRPGNQLRARVAVDLSTGPAGKASLQLTYLHSGEDQLAGANVFRAGDRIQGMGSYAFAAGTRTAGIAYAGVMHRAQGAYLVVLGPTPSAENVFVAGGGFRVAVARAVLLPSLDLRILRRSDGLGEGEVTGIGGSAELPVRAGLTLLPSARARLGRVLLSQGNSSGFTGVDLAIGVRFGAGLP
jgi:hypothetical protein